MPWPSPRVAASLFVGGGIAYIANQSGFRGGFATVDVSNPDDLALISLSDVAAGSVRTDAVAADGSAHVLVIGNVPDPNNPFLSIHVLDVADASDPATPTPTEAASSCRSSRWGSRWRRAWRFIADGSADLLVVRYESIDVAGQPPAVSITALAEDVDPARQAYRSRGHAGSTCTSSATDDVLVRDVEILVNGQPVGSRRVVPATRRC